MSMRVCMGVERAAVPPALAIVLGLVAVVPQHEAVTAGNEQLLGERAAAFDGDGCVR